MPVTSAPADDDPPAVETLETGDGAQQGRLARAARAEQRGEACPAGISSDDVVQGDEVAVGLAGAGHGDHRVLLLRSSRVIPSNVATARPMSRVAAAYAP